MNHVTVISCKWHDFIIIHKHDGSVIFLQVLHQCDVPHAFVWLCMCDMTRFSCATWLIHVCVTWLVHIIQRDDSVMRLLVLPVSMFLPRVLRLCDMTQILVMSNGGFYAIVRTEFYVTSSDPPHVNFFWCESVMSVWHDSDPSMSQFVTVFYVTSSDPPYVNLFEMSPSCLCDMSQILLCHSSWPYSMSRRQILPMSICLRWVRHVCVTWLRSSCVIVRDCILCHVVRSSPCQFVWDESVMSVWHDSDPPHVKWRILCHSSWPYSMSRRQILPMSICLRWVRHVCVTWLRSSYVIVRDRILCHVVRSSPCQFVWDESVMSVWHDSDPPMS